MDSVKIPRELLARTSWYLEKLHAKTEGKEERRRIKTVITGIQEVLDPDTNRSKPHG